MAFCWRPAMPSAAAATFFRRRDRKPRNKNCLSAQIASNFYSQRSNEKLGFVEAHPGLKQFESALKKLIMPAPNKVAISHVKCLRVRLKFLNEASRLKIMIRLIIVQK